MRKFCQNCISRQRFDEDCGGDFLYVTKAPCTFYAYRQGGFKGGGAHKLIKKECKYCLQTGRDAIVRACTTNYCPLWPYRIGRGEPETMDKVPDSIGRTIPETWKDKDEFTVAEAIKSNPCMAREEMRDRLARFRSLNGISKGKTEPID